MPKPKSAYSQPTKFGKEDYHIARRTVAKYREELKIPISKFRRKL